MSKFNDLVKKLPPKPGVYQFFNGSDEIIYVGKAKNLQKRVSSYFKESEYQSYKHNALVSKIEDIRYILVENESDALLLENNLIKENQPRYNILLKDDKTYPWICIKNERFPRVFVTRNFINDGSEYFGPYTSGIMVKTLLDLIRQLYKLRTCNLLLNEESILKNKYRKCLEYQLGNCLAPCEGLQSEAEYNQSIINIREILKGNLQSVITHLRHLMKEHSQMLNFEQAEIIKNKINIIEKFKCKSTIVNPKISNVDVFSIINDEKAAYVNFIKVVQGAVIQAHNIEIVKRTDDKEDEILISVIFDLRKRFNSFSNEIIVPFKPAIGIENAKFTIPLKGDKKHLLELSIRNARSFRNDIIISKQSIKNNNFGDKILNQLKIDLRLKKLPLIIECFDNSNIQGSDPVASCVVFKNGKPFKTEYRHFNIKTVNGVNDFASMSEVIYRRYKRRIEEKNQMPDLIIIDGGKGQLNAAIKSLKSLGLYGDVSIIGIAKRLEEIYAPEDPIPLYIDKNSTSLKLIQKIRDEAHRFGISFHRQKRSKEQIKSAFDSIPGIGQKTRDKILSIESDILKLATLKNEELIKLFGKKTGNILFGHFNKIN